MFDPVIEFIRNLYPGKGVIVLHEPVFTGKEKEYVLAALDSTFVSHVGEFVDQFEKRICEITGAAYTVATINGTAALHVALKLAGVQPGNEVILQPLTFVATANAVAYAGARPVFLDVDRETLGLSPETLEAFLDANARVEAQGCYNRTTGRRIAACVPVHTFGHPCRIDRIAEICECYRLPLVEDAAESLGSTYGHRHTGIFGLCGIYSFNGNKIVTCGGGGALVTADQKLANAARHLTTTAKIPHPYEYVHDAVGYNYRLPNLNAALACAQLEQLGLFLASKRELARNYQEFFASTDLDFVLEPPGARSNYWLNAIVLADRNSRDAFLEATHRAGVMTRPVWRLLSELEMYQDCQTDGLENSRWLADRLVNLPSSVRL